ncbi:MAG: biotin--[acetyl-CoA-carboxylase] ligase [Deltaproteobacteria bacterium]|nr:MAG: biotin--[acetyl-CoA-carboxylase] ligase [Deltaproteobacteria bacterium]
MPTREVRQHLLRLLREAEDGHVSGAALSRTLGMSRAAIWKQVEVLRSRGYRIEAVPSRGYRLVEEPDLLTEELLRSHLEGCGIGERVVCFDQTDSTNIQALRLVEEGAEEGTVLIADSQQAGKGRLGRAWVSPPGVNLYTSVILRPDIPPWQAPQLTFVAAVALVRAIEQVCGLSARVKWPNDVLVDGAKVAGVLSELLADMDRVRAVILGIGLNVNMTREQLPETLRYPATSLALASGRASWSRLRLACALYRQIDELYRVYLDRGFEPVRLAWEASCDLVGRQVQVASGDDLLAGRCAGIDLDGALLLSGGGATKRVLAGDVRPVD